MKAVFLLLLVLVSAGLFAQEESGDTASNLNKSITVGFLQGGGSLVGADLELLLTKHMGLQWGAGFVGFGAGINIHLKPDIRSSFLSLQYLHQGFGETYTQSIVGPIFCYRGKKWFTFQIGLGFRTDEGPALPEDLKKQQAMLLYSIGAYFPFY